MAWQGGSTTTPWHVLVPALFGALTSGFAYSFPAYSGALRVAFGFSQADLDSIGDSQFLVCFLLTINGVVIDRFGPSRTCMLAGALLTVTWTFYGAVASKHIQVANPFLVFCTLSGVAAWLAGFFTAAVFTVVTKNFGEDRSAMVSIAKAWVGLSSGVTVAIFAGFIPSAEEDPRRLHFLYLLAVMSALSTLCAAPLFRIIDEPCKPRAPAARSAVLLVPSRWRVPLCLSISAVLIIVVLLSSFIKSASLSVTIIGILLSPLLVVLPARRQRPPEQRMCQVGTPSRNAANSPLSDTANSPLGTAAGSEAANSPFGNAASSMLDATPLCSHPVGPWKGGPCDLLRRPESWLLWVCAFCLIGGGLFVVTNLSSIVESRSGEAVSASSATMTFSCAQSAARLAAGSLTNLFVRKGSPRSWYFVVLLFTMALAQAMFYTSGRVALFVGLLLSGWAFGSTYSLLVLIVGDVFGRKYFASNYMLYDGVPAAVGSICLAKYMAQTVYMRHADANGKCIGDECFRLAYLCIAGLQVFGLVCAVIFSLRARAVYSFWLGTDSLRADGASPRSASPVRV